ncbi:restriction endonuclease PLD domain-containing protein [Psychromonas sp. CD1]|uniref:restriction endonuclease PLD domain-containing protein n=1 Tax=Psychromonas sp. CD1 TaxID=1979839 RepID=UPI000B9A9EB5|nr:restriction endonuclease PLD domain-containing protein [Psychromonas sp. CD1]
MYFAKLAKMQRLKYTQRLQLIGKLSNLFSVSTTPYLYYRIAEKIYCECFEASDLSRGDVSSDAVLKIGNKNIGVGLKTFLFNNGKTYQKIAEFNRQREDYRHYNSFDLVQKVAELRNNRLNFTSRAYLLDTSIYHCVVRKEGVFQIFEEAMALIDINNICITTENNNIINFSDGLSDYKFNLSKSTLYKRFITDKALLSFPVNILSAPFDYIDSAINHKFEHLFVKNKDEQFIEDTLYLPLYGRNKKVHPRSGLNQWHANGRKRDINEAYIPVPHLIHKLKPNFFPERSTPFSLLLPNNRILRSKLCQQGNKALMSQSNKELGQWILRDILNLKEGEILSYAILRSIGIDSVRIDKFYNGTYAINFSKIDAYESFIKEFE